MTRTRVAVVGAGRWGVNHVRVLAAEPRCELVAIVDPSERHRQQLATLAPQARWSSWDDVLAARDVDAVVIATPASTHVDLALAAFAAGKHVLVEKPLATSLGDAHRVHAAAVASGRVGMVGHLMVYHPAVRKIRALLEAGTLGDLYYLHTTRVNLGQLRSDETALWCLGPHDLSVIDFLLEKQPPEQVVATGQSVLQPGIEDVVFVTLRFPNGRLAHLHLSWLHPRKERRLTLVCSQKMVDFDDQARELRICDKGYDRPPEFTQFGEFLAIRDGDVMIPQLPMEEPLRVELRHFLACIEQGTPPDTDIASGVRITAILAAAERSLRKGGIPLPVET